DEAFELMTDTMAKAIETDGPRSIAVGGGGGHPGTHLNEIGQSTIKKLFNMGSFACPGGCWNDLKFGPIPTLGDIYHCMEADPSEAKLIIFWGVNDTLAKPQEWADSWAPAKYDKGCYFIDVEARISENSEKSDLYLPVRPGCDSYVALAMANVIITEGLQDQDFIDKYTYGYEEFKELALRYTPELVERVAWCPADRIRKAARLYATTKPAMIEIGRGGNQAGGEHSDAGWMMSRAVACLVPLCGQVGVKGSGFSLEASTAMTVNGLFNQWPNSLTFGQPPAKVKPLIDAGPAPISGGAWANHDVFFGKADYKFHFVLINGNPAATCGNYEGMADAFKNIDMFVSIGRIINWTGSAFADIVLPATTWAEMYMWRPDWEYECLTAPAIDPMYECKSDVTVFRELAIRLAKKLNLGLTDEQVWPWPSDREFLELIACNDNVKAAHKACVDEGKVKHAPFVTAGVDEVTKNHTFGVPNPFYAGQEEFIPYLAKLYTNNGAPADQPDMVWFPTNGGTGKALFKADYLSEQSNGVLPSLPIPCEPEDSYYADGNPIESGNWEFSDAVKKGFDLVACGKAHTHWQFLSFNQGMDGKPASKYLREAFDTAMYPLCKINPVDGERLGIKDGDEIIIESQYGKMTGVKAKYSQTCMPKTIIPPTHYAPQQNSIYPYSVSLRRVDASLRPTIQPPTIGPFSTPGSTKRTSGGGQNTQTAVLCKIYKA
ncbi:MAG: molybdopterin-dependent oxidoreductase, partial [Eggerthellaceae bacterium]|nr:molybdopterin-dependent oxidoreductase [Eggerthellaceae bacterium]